MTESNTLPLIQYWTSKKFKSRLDNEIESGGFGKGDLVEVAYSITCRDVVEQLGWVWVKRGVMERLRVKWV